MNSIDGLIENYIEYANVYAPMLNNYINAYGKDGLYIKLPKSAKNLNNDEIYLLALGKSKVSFDYSSELLSKVPVKILVDYESWYASYTGEAVDVLLYFSKDNGVDLGIGDVIIHEVKGKQYFYRIVEAPETFKGMAFRARIKLIQSKNVATDKSLSDRKSGLII